MDGEFSGTIETDFYKTIVGIIINNLKGEIKC